MRTTTRNLKLKANIAILYVDQFEHWTGDLRRNFLVLVVCVCVDLDGWALQLVLLIRGVSDRSIIGPFLPVLFKVRYRCPLYFLFSSGEMIRMVFFCKFIPPLCTCSDNPNASCDAR